MVETGAFKSNPRELITTGMNTCIFIVIKTSNGIIGWHASESSLHSKKTSLQRLFRSFSQEDFVAGFIVPGEDRLKDTLDLKPSCRTMQAMPWTDPTQSRTAILDFLKEFEWYNDLQILPPVPSYKDFVVYDMVHKRPFTYSDTALFDQGCSLDAGAASPLEMMLSGMRL